MTLTVGYIGLGLMGKPMARNLLKAGFLLTVHNRSQAAVQELVAEGATAAESPRALAQRVDAVFSCLPGPADVEKVYLGANGVLAGARAGSVLVDMSTIDPGTHQRIAARAAESGIAYLDAPVSGGTTGARHGTLSIMVGGSDEALERVMPALKAMGQRIYHIGPVGTGAVVKIVNNMMSAISALGVVEGMVLGTKFGIDPTLLFEVVSNSSASSRTLTGTAPAILNRDFEPGFMIDLMHKDVGLAVDLGKQLGVRTLAGALAQQVLQEARGAGLGRAGTAAQVIPLERSAGVEVRTK
ncbi:MAG TPA: NAD(P)-dependent oxidoreductase [Chloroflexota bacterium]|nr:NAD(P)-dependent oxidoreductase [Chloroflexota bacterium]